MTLAPNHLNMRDRLQSIAARWGTLLIFYYAFSKQIRSIPGSIPWLSLPFVSAYSVFVVMSVEKSCWSKFISWFLQILNLYWDTIDAVIFNIFSGNGVLFQVLVEIDLSILFRTRSARGFHFPMRLKGQKSVLALKIKWFDFTTDHLHIRLAGNTLRWMSQPHSCPKRLVCEVWKLKMLKIWLLYLNLLGRSLVCSFGCFSEASNKTRL
jgi:hypothetical protein